MERIKEYLDHRSIASTEHLLEEELHIINHKIHVLEELKENVETRLHTIREAKLQPIGVIETKFIDTRHCHIIHSGYQTDEEMDVLIKKLLNKDENNLYIIGNNKIGSMLSLNSIQNQHYRNYDSVFIIDKHGEESIESGVYVTICYQGDCNLNSVYFPQLINYAKTQNLIPVGPVLEILWVDIHQAEDTGEHITELQLRCISH